MRNGEYMTQAAMAIAKWPKKQGDLFSTVSTVRKKTRLFLKNPGSFIFDPLAIGALLDLFETWPSIFYEFRLSSAAVSSCESFAFASGGSA